MIHQTFNFQVRFTTDGPDAKTLEAGFSECTGLEMSSATKTIREGGGNNQPVHLVGPVSYGTLGLKRGMSENFALWQWFEQVHTDGQQHLRARCEIAVRNPEGTATAYTIVLTGCLPSKIKAPDLMALDGGLAIEELEVAYQTMVLRAPEGSDAANA